MDGKHFVAVEDLAQSLRGTIHYGDGQIELTLSQASSSSQPAPKAAPPPAPQSPAAAQSTLPQPSPAAAQQLETGRIRGTLTYFFDFHTGNKPDTGSKVWLVKGQADFPADQAFVGTSTAVGPSGNPEQYSTIKYSTVDENGSFELTDIPSGQYTVILKSSHTKGALKDKTHFFGRGKPDLRDSDGRMEFVNLSIKPGDTVDASKDFGPDNDR